MIRRKKSDVVDLPEKIYKTEYVELSKAEEKKYKELRDGILDDIDKLIDMDNPLSSIFHLREVTGGCIQKIAKTQSWPGSKKLSKKRLFQRERKLSFLVSMKKWLRFINASC